MGAYRLSIQHNDSYAFREYPPLTAYQRTRQELVPDMSGASRLGVRRCEECDELLDKWNEPLLGLVVKKRKYNVGSTYDGIVLVSRQFKSAYDRESLKGLIFRQLPDDADFLAIRALRAVEFDSGRRQTRFVKPCPRCGILESVIGATPVFLKPGHEIEDCEFVRTDLEFGSGDEKHPLLICGEAAAKGLSSYKFKGLHLVDIDDEAEKGMRFLQSHKSEEPRD